MSAWPPACSMSLCNVHWTVRCGLALAPPYMQKKGVKRVLRQRLLAHGSMPFRRAHVERGPASGVAPSRDAVAILHCAFCASSVGDLCMAVQHEPVARLFALSYISAPPICLVPLASCAANMHNKEEWNAGITNMTVHEGDVHDCDPVRQSHVSAFLSHLPRLSVSHSPVSSVHPPH